MQFEFDAQFNKQEYIEFSHLSLSKKKYKHPTVRYWVLNLLIFVLSIPLHHVFRSVMGKTPQEYLTDERLRQARWLLAQGEKTLSEIAYECGFSSQSHLCARFKENMGCSPGEYRQQIMESYRV